MKKETQKSSQKNNSALSIKNQLAVFRGKAIRKVIYNNEWWYSIADVVEVLTDSVDVRQYIKKMRPRDSQLDSKWGTICTPLELLAPDGKKRETSCANTEGVFRLIQSIKNVLIYLQIILIDPHLKFSLSYSY